MFRNFVITAILLSTAVFTFVLIHRVNLPLTTSAELSVKQEPLHQSVGRSLKSIGGQLSRTMGPVVFWGIVGLLGSLFLLATIVRWLEWRKGSLNFSLREKVYHPQDTVQGTLLLHAKQPIACRKVIVTLRCLVDSWGSDNRRHERVVYQDPAVLLGETTIPAGASRHLPFTVTIPEKVAGGYELHLEESLGTGTLGRVVSSALTMASKLELISARWELLAEVDAEGVDLSIVRRLVVKGMRSKRET